MTYHATFCSRLTVTEVRTRGPPQIIGGVYGKTRESITNTAFLRNKKRTAIYPQELYDDKRRPKEAHYESR